MKGFLNWCFLSHCGIFCAMDILCDGAGLLQTSAGTWWAHGMGRVASMRMVGSSQDRASPPQGMQRRRGDGRWVSPKERFFCYHPQINMEKMHLPPLPASPGALTCPQKELQLLPNPLDFPSLAQPYSSRRVASREAGPSPYPWVFSFIFNSLLMLGNA